MASIDWLSLSNELPSHPKTLALARALKKREAGWYIVTLFAWCSKHCVRGVFSGQDVDTQIEQAADWRGTPGAFAAAARDAGFLDVLPDGSLEVHDWWGWNGEAMSEAIRKSALKREKRAAESAKQGRQDGGRFGSRHGAKPSGDTPATPAKTSSRPPQHGGRGTGDAEAAAPPDVDVDVKREAFCGTAVADPPEGPAPGGVGDEPADGADGTWILPWAGPCSRRIPGLGKKKTRPSDLTMTVEWMLYRQGQRGDEEADIPWGHVCELLKRAIHAHGLEAVHKAWLAWLMDPWAASISPPYSIVTFLAVEQVKKQVDRAKRFDGWERDKLAPDDWDLPWLIDETRKETA